MQLLNVLFNGDQASLMDT